MKRFNRFLGVSTAVLLCAVAYAQPTFAADLGGPAFVEETFTPTVGPSWTAFYVGGQVGGVFGMSGLGDGCDSIPDIDFDPIQPLRGDIGATEQYDYSEGEIENIDCESESDGDDTTWAGGFRFGADVQIQQFVLGAVVDFNWLDDERSAYFAFDPDSGVDGSGSYGNALDPRIINLAGPDLLGSETGEAGGAFQEFLQTQSLEWYGTGRARAGVALGNQGRFLLFGTGGVAFGQVETTLMQRATYTPDEADRVFDTPAGSTPYANDDEYFPDGNGGVLNPGDEETASLPDECVNGPQFGNPLQTAVICEQSASDSSARIGWTAGFGGEFLVTNNFSVGVEALYVNLGDGETFLADLNPFDDGDLDLWTVMATASLRIN